MARSRPIVVKTTVVLKLNSLVRPRHQRGVEDSDHAVVGRQVGVGWGAARSINLK